MPGLLEIAANAAAAMLVAQADPSAPLQLSVRQDGAATIVQVVGLSQAHYSARYALEVADENGGNRSVQRGTVNLQPNSEAVLTTVRLSTSPAKVTAKLSVTPKDGPAYSQTFDPPMQRTYTRKLAH